MAQEAEEKERVAKAAKKARQERESALEASPKLSTPIVSVAESTSHDAVDLTGTSRVYSSFLFLFVLCTHLFTLSPQTVDWTRLLVSQQPRVMLVHQLCLSQRVVEVCTAMPAVVSLRAVTHSLM